MTYEKTIHFLETVELNCINKLTSPKCNVLIYKMEITVASLLLDLF